MSATVATFTYNRAHSVTFVADNMRTCLVRLIQVLGLQPDHLLSDWPILGNAVAVWLASGHLKMVIIEFYLPGLTEANARWDIPVSYTGNTADDMWLDRDHLSRTIAKAPRPKSGSIYRVLLDAAEGRENVPGMVPAQFLSTGNMMSRSAGTLVSTPNITAGLRYWGTAS